MMHNHDFRGSASAVASATPARPAPAPIRDPITRNCAAAMYDLDQAAILRRAVEWGCDSLREQIDCLGEGYPVLTNLMKDEVCKLEALLEMQGKLTDTIKKHLASIADERREDGRLSPPLPAEISAPARSPIAEEGARRDLKNITIESVWEEAKAARLALITLDLRADDEQAEPYFKRCNEAEDLLMHLAASTPREIAISLRLMLAKNEQSAWGERLAFEMLPPGDTGAISRLAEGWRAVWTLICDLESAAPEAPTKYVS